MPSGAEEYRDYTIHWETSSSRVRTLWRVRAGILSPADRSDLLTIHSITGDQFKSEAEAREYVLSAGRQWIDERLANLEETEKSV
jgi:hypothetical protein